MIDWKNAAIDSLVLLEARKTALETIPMEMQLIKSDLKRTECAIKEGLPEKDAVDIQAARKITLKELGRNFSITKQIVTQIHDALSELDEDSRSILEMLYIQRKKRQ